MIKKIIALTVSVVIFGSNVCASELGAENNTPPEINAPIAVVMDADTGVIIYERNKNEKAYPASITKIMTALLSIEHMKDALGGNTEARVPFSYEAVFSIMPGSSHISMNDQETLSFQEALYGLMLASANEVANAMAENAGGTMEEFAKKMTARAKELGAKGTSFTNAHGLPEDDHYTTAYDMALIMCEAVKHPEFVDAISTRTYTIPPTERQEESRILNNSNKMIQPHSEFYNELVVGGKTGYTDAARHTLVTYGNKEQMNIVVVVMQEEKSDSYTDTALLMDYAFDSYAQKTLFDGESFTLPVTQEFNGMEITAGHVEAAASSYTAFFPIAAADGLHIETNIPHGLTAPVAAGQEVGSIDIFCGDVLLETLPVKAKSAVAALEVVSMDETTSPAEGFAEAIDSDSATTLVKSISFIFAGGVLVVMAGAVAFTFIWVRLKKGTL